MNVLKFVTKNATYHSSMTYDENRKSFNLKPYSKTHTGIYFILNDQDILKIGKADGKQGLKGRISTYRTRLVSNYKKGDPTVILWHKVMMEELSNKILSMYLLPLESKKIIYKGIEVEAMIARSLEYKLSELAKRQNHSMKLSGQN